MTSRTDRSAPAAALPFHGRSPLPAVPFLSLLASLSAILYLLGLWHDWPTVRLIAKPIPVLCLLLSVSFTARDRYDRFIAAGLAFSATGDVLLEFPRLFVAGLAAFLCAHVSYIMAFLVQTRRLAMLQAVPFVIWLGLVFTKLRPGLGDMTAPVTVYVIAIGVMMWRAAARIDGQRATWVAAIGSILFGMSDTLIGLDRFHAPIPGVRYAIILLYWAGQVGISQRRPGPAPVRR
jgi:alkenylglycerophosphocholine/alkenylglycerophosphoethanolamine hydrolase